MALGAKLQPKYTPNLGRSCGRLFQVGPSERENGSTPEKSGGLKGSMLGDDPHGAAAGDSAGDVFAFGQCQRTPRTATDRRSDPPVSRQQEMDDLFILTECSTNCI